MNKMTKVKPGDAGEFLFKFSHWSNYHVDYTTVSIPWNTYLHDIVKCYQPIWVHSITDPSAPVGLHNPRVGYNHSKVQWGFATGISTKPKSKFTTVKCGFNACCHLVIILQRKTHSPWLPPHETDIRGTGYIFFWSLNNRSRAWFRVFSPEPVWNYGFWFDFHLNWVKFYIPSACRTIPAIWYMCYRSIRVWDFWNST